MSIIVNDKEYTIGVAIPAFNVGQNIGKILSAIPSYVDETVVIDDNCPLATHKFIDANLFPNIKNLHKIIHKKNLGVGGATKSGFEYLKTNVDYLVKIDADGQIDPRLIQPAIQLIVENEADLVKGNRFSLNFPGINYPKSRKFANRIATLFTKFSTGSYTLEDPVNGLIVLDSKVYSFINPNKLDNRWFFETSIIAQIVMNRGVILELPMRPIYNENGSNLVLHREILTFLIKHIRIFIWRIYGTYFVRNIGIATLSLVNAMFSTLILLTFGGYLFVYKFLNNIEITSGQVMILLAIYMFMLLNTYIFLLMDFLFSRSNSNSINSNLGIISKFL